MDKLGKYGLALTLIVALTIFIWTSRHYETGNTGAPSTFVDEAGRLHVMGLVLGQSSLRDAEVALRSRADTALFMYPDENGGYQLALESYFPSIADHSRVILALDADAAILERVQSQATKPRMHPNGVARMNLGDEALLAVQRLKVKSLTIVPSLQLDGDMIKARFGEPAKILDTDGQGRHYLYPDLGLDALINPDGKERLEFSQPTGRVESEIY